MQNATKFIVTLVRHGETFMNSQRLIQGHSDAALSDKGLEQARQLGSYMRRTTFTKAFSSDLQRAHNTGKQILEQLEARPEIAKDLRLRERCYGDAEGKPAREFIENAAKANIPPSEFVPNGAESIEDLSARAEDFFLDICKLADSAASDEHILIVSHGGWIQGLMRYLYNNSNRFDLKNFISSQAIRIHNNTAVTEMTISRVNDNVTPDKYEINFLKINDTTHLKDQ